jgi:3D (Asp-Asp-Asp) domain-containing protein
MFGENGIGVGKMGKTLSALFSVVIAGASVEAAEPSAALLKLVVRTTAYAHTEADHIKYGNKSALGTVLEYTPEYHFVAADWSRFPLGTKFKIKGYDRIFVVDGCGSALVGTQTIDIYLSTVDRMNHWGTNTLVQKSRRKNPA